MVLLAHFKLHYYVSKVFVFSQLHCVQTKPHKDISRQGHAYYEGHWSPVRYTYVVYSTNADLPATSESFADLCVVNIRPHGGYFTPFDLRPDEKCIHWPCHVARARRRRGLLAVLWRPIAAPEATRVAVASTAAGGVRVRRRRSWSHRQRPELRHRHRCWVLAPARTQTQC